MNEKLCKCPNIIIAHNVIHILQNNDIAFRQQDETNGPHTWTLGHFPGIDIFVFEEDHVRLCRWSN